MGKHAQSRGRYSAWSHSRVFLALESGGQHRTGLGGGLCIRLSVPHGITAITRAD